MDCTCVGLLRMSVCLSMVTSQSVWCNRDDIKKRIEETRVKDFLGLISLLNHSFSTNDFLKKTASLLMNDTFGRNSDTFATEENRKEKNDEDSKSKIIDKIDE